MMPLQGITVVALEQAVAVPFATRQLADLGARVIKIERPKVGDFARHYDQTVHGMSSHFVWLNRSKESLTLNLKHPDAQKVMHALLAKADVFVQNLAPGAVDRLHLGSATLKEKYPNVVICNVSGYGESGPYRDKKAYDLLVQCETGLVSITGSEETPSKVGISVADIAGGMYAYTGILTSLLHRHKTGKGAVINVSLFDSLAEWMGYPMYYNAYGGTAPPRTGASHASIYPYGPYTAEDGKTVFIAIQNEREWERFCKEVIERPEFVSDSRFSSNSCRVAHRDELEPILKKIMRKMPGNEVIRRLDKAQIANARLNTVEEFINHPQLSSRNRWAEVDSPAGRLKTLIPPVTTDNMKTEFKAIPNIGEHNERILKELGFDSQTIQGWRDNGVI